MKNKYFVKEACVFLIIATMILSTIPPGIIGSSPAIFLDEDFTTWLPAGWSTDDFSQSFTNSAGGTSPEARLPYHYITEDYSYLNSTSVNATTVSALTLEFKSYINNYMGGYNCYVSTRSDPADPWTDVTPWPNPITTSVGPGTYYVDITDDIGVATEVSFEYDGPYFNLNYWHIDDVKIYEDIPNDPPYTPYSPFPGDGDPDIEIDTDISWIGGDPDYGDTVTYDVYFGTTSPPPLVESNYFTTVYDQGTMSPGTTHYWKIVAWDNHGASTEGPEWSFTTETGSVPDLDCSGNLDWYDVTPGETVYGSFDLENWTFTPDSGFDLTPEDGQVTVDVEAVAPEDPETEFTGYIKIVNVDDGNDYSLIDVYLSTNGIVNQPPYEPSNPDPYDGETGVDVDHDLSWTGGDPDPGDTVTYDIYFGTTSPPPQIVTGLSMTSYNHGVMDLNTHYFWKIVAWDNHGASTAGPEWDFTTGGNNPPDTPGVPSTNCTPVVCLCGGCIVLICIGEECTYCASTTDPDSNETSFWFDWDDGTNSGWLGPDTSAPFEACTTHSWDAEGIYYVRSKAKDSDDSESDWSDPLAVWVRDCDNITITNIKVINLTAINITTVNLTAINITTVNLYAINITTENLYAINITTENLYAINITTENLYAINITTENLYAINITTENVCNKYYH